MIDFGIVVSSLGRWCDSFAHHGLDLMSVITLCLDLDYYPFVRLDSVVVLVLTEARRCLFVVLGVKCTDRHVSCCQPSPPVIFITDAFSSFDGFFFAGCRAVRVFIASFFVLLLPSR